MKPLTIEELKALPIGDWVWAIFADGIYEPCKGYFQKTKETSGSIFLEGRYVKKFFDYSDSGKTWLAYKNKEQAEEKERCTICHINLENILPKVDKYGNKYCNGCYEARCKFENLKRKQAKCRLAELKGE